MEPPPRQYAPTAVACIPKVMQDMPTVGESPAGERRDDEAPRLGTHPRKCSCAVVDDPRVSFVDTERIWNGVALDR
jgi:hypothetical protein